MNIVIIILILIFCYIAVYYNRYEQFDVTNRVFPPLGQPRYGLRGERLSTHALDDCYYDHYNCYTNTFMNDFTTRKYYGRIYSCDDRASKLKFKDL